MPVIIPNRFSIMKEPKNEESIEGRMSKLTDSWDNGILGHIKIPSPHIPDLHTTSPLLPWECMVMVF
jgi:hypothetical protein